MKILTNKKYNEFVNSSNVYKEMYNNETTKLMLANKDYELQIEEILNRLKEIVSKTNEKMV